MLLFDVGFVLLLVGIAVGALGVRSGSYLCKSSPNKKVFRKPISLTVAAVIIGLGFLLLPFVTAGRDWLLFAFYSVFCLAIAGVILWAGTPSEFRLNLTDCTYFRVLGWPLVSTSKSGSWSDIQEVYVHISPGYSGSKTTYFVGVKGNKIGGQITLGRFVVREAAEQFAQEIMMELGLPRVILT